MDFSRRANGRLETRNVERLVKQDSADDKGQLGGAFGGRDRPFKTEEESRSSNLNNFYGVDPIGIE